MSQTHTIQKQDQLAMDAMTDELRSLIYYGLCALRVDLDRTEIDDHITNCLNDDKVRSFRNNVKVATDVHIEYLKRHADTIKQQLSLINSYAPVG
jgi:hypothetical protein